MTLSPEDRPQRDSTPTAPASFDGVRNESPYSEPPSGTGPTGSKGRPQGLALPSFPDWLTRILLLVNVGMFIVISFLSRGGFMEAVLGGADRGTLIALGAKENALILNGEYWRLITPIFLHIGIVHLLFNSYALNLFGRELETLFGSFRFAAIYFLSGVAGSILSFAFSPYTAAGASGAIFGVIGAMAAFLIRNRETLGSQGRQHLQSLVFMIGINLVLGFTLAGIDNFGHIGGLAAGLASGFALSPTYAVVPTTIPPLFQQVVERPRSLPTAAVTLGGAMILAALFWLAMPIAPA